VNPAWRESILPEWEAMVHWFAGDFPAALASAHEAAARAGTELSKRRALGVVFAALAAAETAQTAAAHGYLNRAKRAFGERPWQFFSHACGHVDGVLAWQEGRTSASLAGFRETAERILGTGAQPFAALVLVDLAELAAECDEAESAADAVERLEAIGRSIDLPVYNALAMIATATRGDADAGRRAVELLASSSWRAFHARALAVLGRSLVEHDPAEALETLQHAAVAFEACGAVWRADRVRTQLRGLGGRGRRDAAATLGASGLSTREREVARLAADGLTAREISERLFIGERTVETHLANIYAKLGVRSKLELVRRASEFALNQ
jgi:DNA-binding NarL/FixJ family response regulator